MKFLLVRVIRQIPKSFCKRIAKLHGEPASLAKTSATYDKLKSAKLHTKKILNLVQDRGVLRILSLSNQIEVHVCT